MNPDEMHVSAWQPIPFSAAGFIRTMTRYHAQVHARDTALKSTRILAIAGVVILVAVLAWWHYQDSHARRMQFSNGHGTPVESPR